MYRFAFLSFCLILILGSCDHSRLFEEYRSVSDHNWYYKDTFEYEVNIRDTTSRYNLYLNLRNKLNYPYRNIWLMVSTAAPEDQLSRTKREFKLANKNGEWLGQGLGDIYDHRFIMRKKVKFRNMGQHTFKINHLMRKDTLPGIMDVGLRLEKVEK